MWIKEYKIDDLSYIEILKNEIKNNISKKFSYNTNVKGQMTDWRYFTDVSKNFQKIKQILNRYYLVQAWGNILNKDDEVLEHCHIEKVDGKPAGYLPSTISGIIYLTDIEPGTYFKDFDFTVKPEVGKIVVFNNEYLHSVSKSKNDNRYTIAFNGRIKESYEF